MADTPLPPTGGIEEEATCKGFLQIRREAARAIRRTLPYYNLDAILDVERAASSALEERVRKLPDPSKGRRSKR